MRPGPIFEFIPTYEGTFIDLPTGKVDIHLATVDSVINFLPDMQLALQAQYDNISENFGFSARYRWEYRPGDEFFVAIGQSAMITNQGFVAQIDAGDDPARPDVPVLRSENLRLGGPPCNAQPGSATLRRFTSTDKTRLEGGGVQRRRKARGAIAPSVVFACALGGGPALAAPAASPAAQPAPSELMLVGSSAAMQVGAGPTSPPPFMRPNVKIVRIDPSEAPTIDADLSDPAWAKAAIIDNFTQRQPNPYEPATERTVVRILYDENNLYFSFYNYDSAPDQIVVRNMQRDGRSTPQTR